MTNRFAIRLNTEHRTIYVEADNSAECSARVEAAGYGYSHFDFTMVTVSRDEWREAERSGAEILRRPT